MMYTNDRSDALLLEYFDELLGGEIPASLPATTSEDYLTFYWGRLKLAIRKEELRGVCEFPEDADPCMLGAIDYQGATARVVDLSKLLRPAAASSSLRAPMAPYRCLVVVQGGKWALPCHRIGGMQKIHPTDIRQRSDRTSREWLLGTSLREQCVVLDVPAIVAGCLGK